MSTEITGGDQLRGWRLGHRRFDRNGLELVLAGRWRLDEGLPSAEILQHELLDGISLLRLNTVELDSWDSGLLVFLAGLQELCSAHDITIDLGSLPHGLQHLLAMAAAVPEQKIAGHGGDRPGWVTQVGLTTLTLLRGAPAMLRFLGEITLAMGRLLTGRAQFRAADLWLEVEEVGPRGQIFIADLVAIGMVREVGALMTGVIIAGRTGAAFAARLGTMQVNEEIDALRTMGISPIDFLVLPRMLALMLMVPLLTLYAGFVGMLAGLLVSATIFDISIFEYYTETLRALEIKHFLVGLCKGTVYGALVAYAGCLRGMQCGRSAEAVGEAATSAVVTGILLITISASILTILFYQLGI